MTEWELLGYEQNQRRLEARRLRRSLNYRSDIRLSVDAVYDLVLAETEDERQASHAASQYAAALLRSGQTPQIS